MLTEPTNDKLKALHLYAMAAAWIAQRGDTSYGELDFDARFSMLVDAETLARDNKRIARSLRDAKLRLPRACMEDIEHTAKREIDRALIKRLATGRWIADHQNVLHAMAAGAREHVNVQPMLHEFRYGLGGAEPRRERASAGGVAAAWRRMAPGARDSPARRGDGGRGGALVLPSSTRL